MVRRYFFHAASLLAAILVITPVAFCDLNWVQADNSAWPSNLRFNGYLDLYYDPLNQQTIVRAGEFANGITTIYSNHNWGYKPGTNQWTDLGGSGVTWSSCIPMLPNLPNNGHPVEAMALDTTRNRWWLGGFVNAACNSGATHANISGSNAVQMDGYAWNAYWTGFNVSIGSATCKVLSVIDRSHLVLDNTSCAIPQGYQAVMLIDPNPNSMYYMDLTDHTWHRISPPSGLPGIVDGNWVYDPDDDIIMAYGYPGYSVYLYCFSVNTNIGCSRANDWNTVSYSGGPPSANYFIKLIWLANVHKIFLFGGQNPAVNYNETWMYDVSARTWIQKCTSGCTPPPAYTGGSAPGTAVPAMAYIPGRGTVIFHQTSGGIRDWEYDPILDKWSVLVSTGIGNHAGADAYMTYDTASGKLVTWSTNGGGDGGFPEIWIGTLSAGSGPIISSFTANPATIGAGSSSTLSWSTVGATSVSITPGTFTSSSASGSVIVNPSSTTVYTLTATNSSGSAMAQATVTVSDTTNPTVSVTSPTNGATVSGTITITATASDNVAVAGVQFKADGNNIGAEDTTSPYSATLDTTTLTNGAHTISATARDTSNNVATSSVTVTVNNAGDTTPPTVSITSPSNGATVSGMISITATASDNVAVAGVQFKADGVNTGSEDLTSPYSTTLDTTTLSNGAHTLSATARDTSNNIATASVSVTVNNAFMNASNLPIPLMIQEALYPGGTTGITRTQDPVSVGVPLPDGAGITSISQLGLSGASAGQFRILGRWPSGNAKWVLVDTLADVSAGGMNTGIFVTSGSGNFGGSSLATDNGATITVNTGSAQFTIRKANFNVIDQAVVNGKTILSSGTSQGLVVTGPAAGQTNCTLGCTTTYSSANDPLSSAVIEENGPVKAVIRATGSHKDASGNAYMQYTVRLYFYKNRNYAKVTSILRNADYGKSNTFETATKGMQSYELRLSPSLSGTLNYNIGTDSTPQSGTLSGTDSAYIYQATTNVMQWNDCPGGPQYCSPTPDMGFSVVKNGATLYSKDENSISAGWADISDSSGKGVEIGVYQMGPYFPKSLEFNNGGADVRIGIFARENSVPVYQSWPQWHIDDLYLNFHDSSLATPGNEFLKFQNYLVARADVAYYNAAHVFPYPMPTAAEEDAFYTATGNSADPGIGSWWNMALYKDGVPAAVRFMNWGAGGGPSLQEDFRWQALQTFIKRGFSGGYLMAAQFYRMQAQQSWAHEDGVNANDSTVNGFRWRDKPNVMSWQQGLTPELTVFGEPSASSLNGNLALMNNWITGSGTDEADANHMHWYGMPDYYFMSGDETMRDAMVSLKDYYLNNVTCQAAGVPGWNLGTTRALGIDMIGSSRFSDYLRATGDPDWSGVLAHGEATYDGFVRPDICVADNITGKTYPAGCTVPWVNNYGGPGGDGSGISRVRGLHTGWTDRGQYWCIGNNVDNGYMRISDSFMNSLLIEGMLGLRNSEGSNWNYYKEALDLAYGVGQWTLADSYSDDGQNHWNSNGSAYTQSLYNGMRYKVAIDLPLNCSMPSPGSTYNFNGINYWWSTVPSPEEGMWMNFYVQQAVNGRYTQDQIRKFTLQLQRTVVGQSGIHLTVDYGGYQLGSVISGIDHPGAALQSIPFNATNLGGGSYRLSWTVPQGTQGYRIKYSDKNIVDWLNFDPMFNTFITSPDTNTAWFAANTTNEPAPQAAGTVQSFTISGLDTAKPWYFSVKAFLGNATPDTTPPSIPAGASASVLGGSVSLSWNPSTDPDDAVSYYTVYRNGTLIATTQSNAYTDNAVSQGSSYSYTISATDTHGNPSGQSSAVFASIPSTKSPDINGDGIVNSLDFSVMNRHWLTNYSQADLNSDGTVNSLDFSILASRWGMTG